MNIPESPRILIVDDHVSANEMLKRLFESYNYQVDSAFSGEEALELLKIIKPDLIILDVMMKGLNGFEVLQILRDDLSYKDIPTIMCTAKDSPADVEHGLTLGADDYVTKPIKPRELLARSKSKIEAYYLRQTIQRKTEDLSALLGVAEQLNTQLPIEDVLNLIADMIFQTIQAKGVALCQYNDYGEIVHTSRYLMSDIKIDWVTILTNLNSTNASLLHIPLENHQQYSILLQTDSSTYGAMVIHTHHILNENEIDLIENISKQSSMAIQNALFYDLKMQYAEHLEDMVEKRTNELQKAQQLLIRSEKLASVGRLAAGLAHEINNPLFPILINLNDMLEDLNSDIPIQIIDVEKTLESAERIQRIVKRLLEFAGNRNEPSHMTGISLMSILNTVLKLVNKLMSQSNIVIELNGNADIAVYGNKDQLEQVFLNLILNSQAAMPDGGTIQIFVTEENDIAIARIIDTGIGIPKDNIANIFDPFVTTKDNGTGLGLFITHEIVQNHNGTIEIQSEAGVGTVVSLSIPSLTPVSE